MDGFQDGCEGLANMGALFAFHAGYWGSDYAILLAFDRGDIGMGRK